MFCDYYCRKWYVDGLPSTALLKIKPPQVGLHALTMPNFYTLFFFYLCGLCLASVAFIVEERKKIVQEGRRRLSTVSLVNWQYDGYEAE